MAGTGRPAWVDDELFPFESRFIAIDGHTVHYADEGSGPTLLLLHGHPTWSFDAPDRIAAAIRDWRFAPRGRRTAPARWDVQPKTPRKS